MGVSIKMLEIAGKAANLIKKAYKRVIFLENAFCRPKFRIPLKNQKKNKLRESSNFDVKRI